MSSRPRASRADDSMSVISASGGEDSKSAYKRHKLSVKKFELE